MLSSGSNISTLLSCWPLRQVSGQTVAVLSRRKVWRFGRRPRRLSSTALGTSSPSSSPYKTCLTAARREGWKRSALHVLLRRCSEFGDMWSAICGSTSSRSSTARPKPRSEEAWAGPLIAAQVRSQETWRAELATSVSVAPLRRARVAVIALLWLQQPACTVLVLSSHRLWRQ